MTPESPATHLGHCDSRFIDTQEGITLVEDGPHVRGATELEKDLRADLERARKHLSDLVEAVEWPADGTATMREREALARAIDYLGYRSEARSDA